MAASKLSITALVFGIINIVVALAPPFAGCMGASYFYKAPHWPYKNVDLGPPVRATFDKDLRAAQPEAITLTACDSFLSLMLIAGAVGLFFNHDWARWLTVGTALLIILTLCIHDIYQLAVVRATVIPVMTKSLQQVQPPIPPAEATGAQFGFTASFFCWSWANSIVIIYLLAMSITLAATRLMSRAADGEDDSGRRRRRRDRDED